MMFNNSFYLVFKDGSIKTYLFSNNIMCYEALHGNKIMDDIISIINCRSDKAIWTIKDGWEGR